MEEILRAVLICLPVAPSSAAIGSPSSSSSAAAATTAAADDRISRLPDAVLSRIVSRLPAEEAARTAVLSSRWRRVWASTPLVLDDSDLLDLPSGGGGDPDPLRIDWLAVNAAVSRVLAAHPGPFRCVRLTCCLMCAAACAGALPRWLRLLAAKGVQDLVLVNRPWPDHVPLPADVLRIASLRRLYLGLWRFPDTAGLPRGPGVFPHLREIGLCYTIISTGDIEHLLACSPVLDKLAIVVSYHFPCFVRIRSRSLRCLVIWESLADELAVVVAPRLERLILWQKCPCLPDSLFPTKVRIGYATELKVLGYLEPSIHQLVIGGKVIESATKMSPCTMVPSVKILALKVRFGIRKEAKTLPTFLRCFPNAETLHVMSHEAHESTGKLNLKFWQEVGPIDCLEAHITKVVFNMFRGERSELAFLRFVLERAQSLLKLVVVLAKGDPASENEMVTKLKSLATAKRASECPTLSIIAREGDSAWCFQRASNLSVKDPFDG
ncbi:hypothetical protein ACP70R_037766 [Stipagrostis hirtigluma subsp. patula]